MARYIVSFEVDDADDDVTGVVGREEDMETDLVWTELNRDSGDCVLVLYGEMGGGEVGGVGTAGQFSLLGAAPSVVATTFNRLSSVRSD